MKIVMMIVSTRVVAAALRAIRSVAFTPEASLVVKAEHLDFFLYSGAPEPSRAAPESVAPGAPGSAAPESCAGLSLEWPVSASDDARPNSTWVRCSDSSNRR